MNVWSRTCLTFKEHKAKLRREDILSGIQAFSGSTVCLYLQHTAAFIRTSDANSSFPWHCWLYSNSQMLLLLLGNLQYFIVQLSAEQMSAFHLCSTHVYQCALLVHCISVNICVSGKEWWRIWIGVFYNFIGKNKNKIIEIYDLISNVSNV